MVIFLHSFFYIPPANGTEKEGIQGREGTLNGSLRVSDHGGFSGRPYVVSSLDTPKMTLKLDFDARRHFVIVLS